MPKYAPKRGDGLAPYVRETSSWGKTHAEIVWAETLAAAKREFGWSRMQHTSVSVRRATPEDMPVDSDLPQT